jgi:fido (protein-threonine AMPylation protein)
MRSPVFSDPTLPAPPTTAQTVTTPTDPNLAGFSAPLEHAALLAVQGRLHAHLRALNEGHSGGGVGFDWLTVFPDGVPAQVLRVQIDALKKCLDSFRPLTASESVKLAEAFDLEYTYESNRIEGNSLTLAETQVVLAHGVTVSGKPLIHHLEAVSHRDALVFVKNLVQTGQAFTPAVLLEINRIILKGSVHEAQSGRFRRQRVAIAGSRHVPPNYVVVPDKMDELFADLAAWQASGHHPVDIAADLHFQIARIHPFIDGNGRTARLVMSFWLMQNGYTIANLSGSNDDRLRYYNALEEASVQRNLTPFRTLIYEREKASLIWHLDGLTPDIEAGRGGDYLACLEGWV